jgi:Mn-dependent DtxR family transcriptional regulator/Fe2+ transport system protein FeoA
MMFDGNRIFWIALVATLALVLLAAASLTFAARWRRSREQRRRVLIEDALKYVHGAELRRTPATPESLAGQLRLGVAPTLDLIADMEAQGLIRTTGVGLTLTLSGQQIAIRIIRAHRLFERYLADELRMPLAAVHAAADRREHRMTPEEIAVLEARLGYPTYDPHGDPIPKPDGRVLPLEAVALSEQSIGKPAVIVHLEDEPPELFRQIAAAGLEPGMCIELIDATSDQLVIWDGEREHVLSPVAAGNVFVAPLPRPTAPIVRLTSLETGEQGRVVALRSHGLARRRLLDLGVTPGTMIERAFVSPFGQPAAYRVRGALIALRAEQANQIEIEPLGRASA